MMKIWTFLGICWCVCGCVVENRAESEMEAEQEAVMMPDAGVQAAPDLATLAPVSCDDEDDLYSSENIDIEVGFERSDLYLCSGTTDRFLLSGVTGQRIFVQLTAASASNDLDLNILDESGEILATSAGETGSERIPFRFGTSTRRIIVEVSGYQDVASAYSLEILPRCESDRDCSPENVCDQTTTLCVTEQEPNCGMDEFEPNNREGQATPIDNLANTISASICAEDVDWYAFEANRGDTIEILANFPEGIDLDLTVIRTETGERVGQAIGDAQSNPERLLLSHVEAGAYVLGIQKFLAQGASDQSIDYTLDFVGRSGACESDRECRTAEQPICQMGVCVSAELDVPLGGICGANEDCDAEADLCFTGRPGGQDNLCTVTCESDDGCDTLGDGAYCVQVGRRTAICIPACTMDQDCGDFYVCTEGRCTVDAQCRTDQDCASGRLCRTARTGDRYCAAPAPEATCGEDVDLEPNSSFDSAVALVLGQRIQDLRICNEDDDYFRFELPESDTPWRLDVEVTFRAGTDIDLYLYDSVGNLLGEAITPERTTERVVLDLLPPGTIYARIDQFDSNRLDETTYGILATTEPSSSNCLQSEGRCAETRPLRSICEDTIGACISFEGNGAVELGGGCDSDDDCTDAADICWISDTASPSICTKACANDEDCVLVADTECVRIGRGVRVCL